LTKSRTASRDGRPLDLSTKEFGVLEALLKASPSPVSAEITRIRRGRLTNSGARLTASLAADD
jgi:DNA-binding response OmpR family regulator